MRSSIIRTFVVVAVSLLGGAAAWGSLFATGTARVDSGEEGAWFTTSAGDSCGRWVGTGEAVTLGVVRTACGVAAQMGHDLLRDATKVPVQAAGIEVH